MPESAGKSLPIQLISTLNINNEFNDNYRIGGLTIVIMRMTI